MRALAVLSLFVTACAEPGVVAPPPKVAAAPSELVASDPLETILSRSPRVRAIMDDAESYRLQVVVAVAGPTGAIERREGYRADAEYFYPASSVKLCSAVAALAKLADLRTQESTPDIDTQTRIVVDDVASGRSSSRAEAPSIASTLMRALVFSDNDAHNLLSDLVGRDEMHERLWSFGLSSVRLRHRLGRGPADDAAEIPRVELRTSGDDPYVIAARHAVVDLGTNDMNGVLIGDSHREGSRRVDTPMSFAEKNRVSLQDLQDLLVYAVLPDVQAGARLRLPEAERALLLDALSTWPSDRGGTARMDLVHRPIATGASRVVPRERLRSYGKSGRAYGFVVDNAYVVDLASGRSFFVAAALYANANGCMGDDAYEYEQVALPVLADIGEALTRSFLGELDP